jgi:hypothetical protein
MELAHRRVIYGPGGICTRTPLRAEGFKPPKSAFHHWTNLIRLIRFLTALNVTPSFLDTCSALVVGTISKRLWSAGQIIAVGRRSLTAEVPSEGFAPSCLLRGAGF